MAIVCAADITISQDRRTVAVARDWWTPHFGSPQSVASEMVCSRNVGSVPPAAHGLFLPRPHACGLRGRPLARVVRGPVGLASFRDFVQIPDAAVRADEVGGRERAILFPFWKDRGPRFKADSTFTTSVDIQHLAQSRRLRSF